MSTLKVSTIAPLGTDSTNTVTLGSGSDTISLGSSAVQSNLLQPSFMATLSSDQTLTDATDTKVTFDNEVFDTSSKYDNSTNYRFTTTVAGTYNIFCSIHGKSNANSELEDFKITLQKNGSALYIAKHNPATNDANQMTKVLNILDTADADDYYEIFCFINDASGNPTIEASDGGSYFGAFRIGE